MHQREKYIFIKNKVSKRTPMIMLTSFLNLYFTQLKIIVVRWMKSNSHISPCNSWQWATIDPCLTSCVRDSIIGTLLYRSKTRWIADLNVDPLQSVSWNGKWIAVLVSTEKYMFLGKMRRIPVADHLLRLPNTQCLNEGTCHIWDWHCELCRESRKGQREMWRGSQARWWLMWQKSSAKCRFLSLNVKVGKCWIEKVSQAYCLE